MQQHGLGRLRQTLEKLGLVAREVPFAAGPPVPTDCAVLVEANPRTRYSGTSELLRRYLERGGSAMVFIEPD